MAVWLRVRVRVPKLAINSMNTSLTSPVTSKAKLKYRKMTEATVPSSMIQFLYQSFSGL